MIGAPCNPFSTQRGDRFKEGSVCQHDLFKLSFDGVVSVLKTFSPASVVMETTDGFMKPVEKGSADTPLLQLLGCIWSAVGRHPFLYMVGREQCVATQLRFIRYLRQQSFKHGYHVAVQLLDMKIWMSIRRCRSARHGLSALKLP